MSCYKVHDILLIYIYVSISISISIYPKVLISVWVSVCLSDHNAGTPGPICLKFIWETREEHGNVLSLVLKF